MTQRIVIVGGTSGIGLAAAARLTDAGHQVVITGRTPARLQAALDQLGDNVTGRAADARDAGEMRALFAELGRADHVVITVTGTTAAGPFREIDPADLRRAVDDKLVAHTIAAQAALDVLRPDGSLTFVTAVSAGAAMPGTAGLAAINAAIGAMVPVLAVELAPLRVNAVAPGVIETPWWDWLDPAARETTFTGYAERTPAGRVGRAEDVASAIAYLIDNTYTTGVTLPVDGGVRLA